MPVPPASADEPVEQQRADRSAQPLSRRSFLQGLAVVAGALALDPFRQVVTDGAQYRNLRLGLSVTRPAGWEYGSVADFGSLRELTALLDELPEQAHPLKDPDNLPVLLLEQPTDDYRPAVTLYDEPLDGPAPHDECSGHARMLRGFGMSYRDLQVLRAPEPIRLHGASGTLSTWSYTHEVADVSKRLSVRTVVVFRGDRVHTFHLVDALAPNLVPGEVWNAFLASIRYERPVAIV